jgi:hypothetical protein
MPALRGVVQCCVRGHMKAGEKTYRLYNCGRCAQQVRICSDCDRGNRYCAGECAAVRRRESLLRAARRYQRSYRGACAHAARQSAWRERQAQEVTHHGSIPTTVWVTVASSSTQTTTRGTHVDIASLQPHAHSAAHLALAHRHRHAACHAHRMVVSTCSFCGGTLPPFARLGALRGGA